MIILESPKGYDSTHLSHFRCPHPFISTYERIRRGFQRLAKIKRSKYGKKNIIVLTGDDLLFQKRTITECDMVTFDFTFVVTYLSDVSDRKS